MNEAREAIVEAVRDAVADGTLCQHACKRLDECDCAFAGKAAIAAHEKALAAAGFVIVSQAVAEAATGCAQAYNSGNEDDCAVACMIAFQAAERERQP